MHQTARLGLSEVLGRAELTAEDWKEIGTGVSDQYCGLEYLGVPGRGHHRDMATTRIRLSLEAVIRVRHQLDYFLSAEHLENNAHARGLYKSNGMKFYVKDFMSWPSMAGLTEMEIISVCKSLTFECGSLTEDLFISGDFFEKSEMTEDSIEDGDPYEWYDLTDEEKASANLREVFVMSDRCKSFFMRSEAAIRSEL